MALAARLRDTLDVHAQSLWSDDGIALHFPDSDAPPPLADLQLDPDEIEELVLAELGSPALFGSRFRENAAWRALIPRRRPGQRTPLWQQRPKAQSLLEVARRYLAVLLIARDLPRVPPGRVRPAGPAPHPGWGIQT